VNVEQPSASVRPRRTLALVSQVYVPDPASVGQHVADVAASLAARGHRVVVYTSARGYEDSRVRYPSREVRDGVEVRRLPLSSFGRRSNAVRFLAGVLFTLQATLRLLFVPGLDGVMVSTTPPVAPVAGIVTRFFRRRVRVVFWVMDLNPDQLLSLGLAKPTSLVVRAFDAMNRGILRAASSVIVLDRFMAERVAAKLDGIRRKIVVLPPWAHHDDREPPPAGENPFRARYAKPGQTVVMYSGNFSPTNPLGTVLEAARRLQDDPRFVFLFIGGGTGKREVEQAGLRNAVSLPYQPLDQLHLSLGAADVHVVTLGDEAVGIVHPCKAYGAMAMSRPLLFVGPDPSHVADLVQRGSLGWAVRHGDVNGVLAALDELDADPARARAAGRRGHEMIAGSLSREALCTAVCDQMDGRASPAPGRVASMAAS
jgi:glycosyltransferase involved in cell wall biosynthesis